MTCYYGAPFHLGIINALTPLGTITFRHTGEPSITVTIPNLEGNDSDGVPSKFFWHFFDPTTFQCIGYDKNATVRLRNYSIHSLGRLITQTVQAEQVLNTWPETNFRCLWVESTLAGVPRPSYRMTNGSAFTYQFSTLAGARLFGANSTAESASLSTHEFNVPTFILFPSTGFCSAPSDDLSALDYEPTGIGSLPVSDSGIAYGNSRLVAPLYRNWAHEFEPPEKTFRRRVTNGYDWAHQDIFEYCRSTYPYYVANGDFDSGNNYEVFILRSDGNSWKPRRASIANGEYFHIDYRAVTVGAFQTPS